jgi:hypothetical protein
MSRGKTSQARSIAVDILRHRPVFLTGQRSRDLAGDLCISAAAGYQRAFLIARSFNEENVWTIAAVKAQAEADRDSI